MLAEPSLTSILRLLSDPTRLRVLSLLERAELSVGELCRALGLAQSRVSNHLRLLREANLLAERHVGPSTFVRLAAGEATSHHRIWRTLREEFVDTPEHHADLARLERVLEQRRAKDGEFFDRVATEWDKIAGHFSTGQARQRAAASLLPRDYVVADLGCGTGYFAEALLGLCARLICVDRSEAMLAEAKKRLRKDGRTKVEWRKGELDALPLSDGEAHAVVCGMVLHHLPAMDAALREMRRVLAPGGSLALLELSPHREAWMRQALGDRHLGIEAKDVVAELRRAGFTDLAVDPAADAYRPRDPNGREVDLDLYVVRAKKPA